MKIAVIDKHKDALQMTTEILNKIDCIEFVCYTSVKEFDIDSRLYEFVLMEIDMPDVDGVEYSRTHLNTKIIFLTNNKDRMQDAFGMNVYGFINKDDCFEIYRTIIEDTVLRIKDYNKITLKTDQGIHIFNVSDIVYLQYIGNRAIGMVYNGKPYCVFGYTLKDIEEKLGDNFVYIDRGIVVNIEKVISIDRNKLYLKGIVQDFEISKRRVKLIKKLVNNF